jgi:sugar phosphate isomerase/epimerase
MIPISLQLWSVRDDFKKDFAGTVAQVAKFGYQGVELAGTGNLTVKEVKKVLDDLGLKVSGSHTGLEPLTTKFEQTVEEMKLLQNKDVIVPWAPSENFASVASCLAFGEKLGELGAKLRAAGLRLSYHNHAQEYALVEGRPALEWMLEASAPRDVSAEVDVYWAFVGGVDPVRAITRLGARARLLHLKDGADNKQTELGRGKVNFPAIFDVAEKNGLTEWYVVEQEQYNFAPLESVRLCLEYLRSVGKV